MKEIILTKRKSGLLSAITCILFLAATAAGAVLAGFSGADGAAPWIGLCAAGIIALLCHSMVMRRGMPVLLLTAAECVFAACVLVYGGIRFENGGSPVLLAVGAVWLCIGWIPFCGLKVLRPQEGLSATTGSISSIRSAPPSIPRQKQSSTRAATLTAARLP